MNVIFVSARLAITDTAALSREPGRSRSSNFTLRQVAMTHQPARGHLRASSAANAAISAAQFRVNRLFDQLARAVTKDGRKRVGTKSRWIGQLG